MKKITFTLFLTLCTLFSTNAQVSFSGSEEYGILKNFIYDISVENRIYATTRDKHIMVSNDNGVSWNVFHTISDYAFLAPQIRQMKLTNNGDAISYIEYYGNASSLNKLTVLDLETLTILKQYSMPNLELFQNFGAYTIYDDGTFNTVFLLANGSTDRAYYTTNGGTDWTIVYDASNDEGVLINDVAIDPNNAQKLYIARNGGPGNVDGGLLISEDAGQTWSLTLDGLILQSVAINPSNSNEVYAGSGVIWGYLEQHHALYHSIDGGETWTEITDITWTDGGYDNVPHIAFNPNNSNHRVVLGDDQIAVTMDAGTSWTTVQHEGANAGDAYWIGEGVAFNPYNTNEVFIPNSHYGYKSIDGGITLTRVENPFYEVMGHMAVINDGTEQHLMYGAQYGYVSRNLANEVETPIDVMPLNEFPMSGQIYQMRADGDYTGRTYSYVGSFMGNSLQVSDDYGFTKNPIYSSFDTQFTAVDTDPTNSNIAWVATFNGNNATVVKIDFTEIFNPQTTYITLPFDLDWVYGLKINDNNPDEVLLTVGNQLFKTINGGTSWTEITTGLEDLALPNIALSLVQNPLNPNQYTMAASNGIYTSLDNGNTWSRIYDQLINKVEHSTETNGHIVGVGYSIQDILPKVVASSDAGANWTEKTADNYFNTIFISSAIKFDANSADVYIGTLSLGLLKDQIDFSTLSNPDFDGANETVKVFPNPTNGIINIALNHNDTIAKTTIYNLTGQKVMQLSNQNQIDMSQLADGMYILKIKSTSGASIVKQVIKN